MIFGRNRKQAEAVEIEDPAEVEDLLADEPVTEVDQDEEIDEPGLDGDGLRGDGPFDITEVDLSTDGVGRLDLGCLVVTPAEGFGLQVQVEEVTKRARAVTAVWERSALEVTLYAAPASGGLAAELREDLLEESEQAGGSATVAAGPFGAEVRRVLAQAGPQGQQLFQVSRIWFAEGPRWLLRGVLLGEAALPDGEAKAAPFVEFFRNLVVNRGSKPMVPGEIMNLTLPQGGAS